MAKRTKKLGPVARFGARYGAGIRLRVLKVELRKRAKYVCPQCKKKRLRWVAVGIWKCTNCGFVMAGGAWDPLTDAGKRLLTMLRELKGEEVTFGPSIG